MGAEKLSQRRQTKPGDPGLIRNLMMEPYPDGFFLGEMEPVVSGWSTDGKMSILNVLFVNEHAQEANNTVCELLLPVSYDVTSNGGASALTGHYKAISSGQGSIRLHALMSERSQQLLDTFSSFQCRFQECLSVCFCSTIESVTYTAQMT